MTTNQEPTRKCAAWIGCGNLAVPVAQISFRGFCPDCEAVATSSEPADAGIVDSINGVCWAASRFNLHQFCEILGWQEDEYAADKFRDLQQAARLLGRFGNTALIALVRAGRAATGSPDVAGPEDGKHPATTGTPSLPGPEHDLCAKCDDWRIAHEPDWDHPFAGQRT